MADTGEEAPTSNDRKIEIYLHLIQHQVQSIPNIGRSSIQSAADQEVVNYAA
jgi:hypothetical protein